MELDLERVFLTVEEQEVDLFCLTRKLLCYRVSVAERWERLQGAVAVEELVRDRSKVAQRQYHWPSLQLAFVRRRL